MNPLISSDHRSTESSFVSDYRDSGPPELIGRQMHFDYNLDVWEIAFAAVLAVITVSYASRHGVSQRSRWDVEEHHMFGTRDGSLAWFCMLKEHAIRGYIAEWQI